MVLSDVEPDAALKPHLLTRHQDAALISGLISTTDFVDAASRRCFNGRILLTQIKRWETQRDQILIKEGIENVSIPRQKKKAKFIVGEKNIEITGNSRHGGSSAGDQMERRYSLTLLILTPRANKNYRSSECRNTALDTE